MSDFTDALVDQWRRERPDLDFWPVDVVGRVGRLARLLEREFRVFFAEHGLEKGEWDVLAALRRSGEPYAVTAGTLLRSELLTSGAVTNRVDRMEEKGLVERVRDTQDRRAVLVRLTDRGRALADELIGSHLANEERLLAHLTRDENAVLADSLRKLLEGLEAP